jgi:murein DD-endopeptidase MepM/ murein hydrolase activator NlpD
VGYPLKDPVVTCEFDTKGKVWRAGRHTGTDFRAARGTEIIAIADGKIVYAGRAGWGPSYGLQVIVQHGKHRVIYAHLSRLNLQGIKDKRLSEGDVLGWSGATGNAFGPHLHLEARVAPYRYNVDAVDPMPLITGETETKKTTPKPAKKASSSVKKA